MPAFRFRAVVSRRIAVACATLVLALLAHAQPQSPVENLSTVAPDGTRTLEQRVLVPAPAAAVWEAWTTPGGLRAWLAPVAGVELRRGGVMDVTFDFAGKVGDLGNIRNEFIAMVPGRMFAVRNVQAPPKAPFDTALFQTLHTVVFIEPKGASETLVTVVMPGVGDGAAADSVYKHFEWGNAYTLTELRRRFVEGPRDWAKLEAEMKAKAARGK